MFHSTKTLVKTRMKCDAEAAKLAFKWFEENNPFDHVFLNRIYEHCREHSGRREEDAVKAGWTVRDSRSGKVKAQAL